MEPLVLEVKKLEHHRLDDLGFGDLSFDLKLGQGALVLSKPVKRASQLLRVLATMTEPASGLVRWFGTITSPPSLGQVHELRRQIGWVHRETRLVSNMNILDNMILGMIYHGNMTRQDAFFEVKDLLEYLGLGDDLQYRPADLTYEKNRLAVYARELAKNPRLFLIETPFLDLDTDFPLIMDLIRKRTDAGECAFLISEVELDPCQNWVDWMLALEPTGGHVLIADRNPGLPFAPVDDPDGYGPNFGGIS